MISTRGATGALVVGAGGCSASYASLAKRKASSAGGDVRSFFAPKAKKPAPKKPSASDVVFDVDAEPWTCSKCTYAHSEAEAGFLQCAACGAAKV